ncbi:MAG: cytochrome c biogenesis protein CcdA [Candidatus Omnitrophota bacterium]|jgi:thiol:disulfide interchange protein
MNPCANPLNYLGAFLGGVGISFTPCVYPLIPVILGYIGIKAETKKFQGFTLSLAYVAGIAVTYSILGLVASLTGKIFGVISAHPLTRIFTGALIIVFGLSMLDIIPLPRFIKSPVLKEKSYFSIFLLGLASGLIISPCTAPALGAILVYLAAKQNIFYGASLLFTFAFGMGLVLILAGTFSSLLINLPKLGKRMVYIKKSGAFILIAIGVYFIFIAIRRL